MSYSLISLALLAPLCLVAFAGMNFLANGVRPWSVRLTAIVTTFLMISAASVSLLFGLHVFLDGGLNQTSFVSGWLRLDIISVPVFVLVAFLGGIILSFSRNYLDGEQRQAQFTGWICLALTCVLGLIISDSLVLFAIFWIGSSFCLNALLLFYKERRTAIRAARKEFLFSRLSDVCLIVSMFALWSAFDTLSIAEITGQVTASEQPVEVFIAAAFLALAAILKCAQFPTHGWLTEVMEAPTPVSALLHAGVINAGGFALIRFADVMTVSPVVLAFLVMIGGFTALFASLVMLTQSAVKTSLGWSTIAQMGFMILQCGLTLFPLALLHIVLHSLYKAHAFLSSGEAVKKVALVKKPGPIAIPSVQTVAISFVIGLTLYIALNALVGLDGKSPQALAMGAILVLGVSYLLAQGLAGGAPRKLMMMTAIYAAATSASYILFHKIAELVTKDALPSAIQPGGLEWALIILTLVSFAAAAFAQSTFPIWAHHPAVRGLRIHLANGFYVNALLDRALNNRRINLS